MEMKPSRFTEEQIRGILREQEAGARVSESVGKIAKALGKASVTFPAGRREARPHVSVG